MDMTNNQKQILKELAEVMARLESECLNDDNFNGLLSSIEVFNFTDGDIQEIRGRLEDNIYGLQM